MACKTITAITNSCELDYIGGIRRMFAAERSNVLSVTYASPSGVIDDINMVSPNVFVGLYFKKNTSTYNQSKNTNGAVTQTLTLVINTINSAAINAVESLFRKDVIILLEDNNSKWWMFGEKNGLESTLGDIVPGTNGTDIPSITVTLVGTEYSYAKEVTDAAANSVI